MNGIKDRIINRFLKYVRFETTSDPNSNACPSTKSQIYFADFLAEQCKKIGLADITRDQYGYVYAVLPANDKNYKNKIGFIAHMDTAPDFNGKNVSPRIIKNYDGKDILLDKNKILSISE